MPVDQNFLNEVEKAGWVLRYVKQEEVLVICPRHGCDLRITLKPNQPVPNSCGAMPETKEIVFDSYDAWRKFMIDRREGLGLSIRDMEAIAGLADDHLAKIESETKIPNLETAIMISQAAGVQLFARFAPLIKLAKRTIVDTRDQLESRTTMQKHHRARRQAKRAASDAQ